MKIPAASYPVVLVVLEVGVLEPSVPAFGNDCLVLCESLLGKLIGLGLRWFGLFRGCRRRSQLGAHVCGAGSGPLFAAARRGRELAAGCGHIGIVV